MIAVHLNGEVQKFEEPVMLGEVLERLQIRLSAMAVAVNQEIVPRSEIGDFKINDGDRVEVVRAVGGG